MVLLCQKEIALPTLPYRHFQGDCAEALAHYQAVFGGTDLQIMRYADGPQAPDEWTASARIMHGKVTLGDGTLMASDCPPGVEGEAQAGFSVTQTTADAATGRAIFDQPAQGCVIIDAFRETFFSPGFGRVKDKFGTHWIISALSAQS